MKNCLLKTLLAGVLLASGLFAAPAAGAPRELRGRVTADGLPRYAAYVGIYGVLVDEHQAAD